MEHWKCHFSKVLNWAKPTVKHKCDLSRPKIMLDLRKDDITLN